MVYSLHTPAVGPVLPLHKLVQLWSWRSREMFSFEAAEWHRWYGTLNIVTEVELKHRYLLLAPSSCCAKLLWWHSYRSCVRSTWQFLSCRQLWQLHDSFSDTVGHFRWHLHVWVLACKLSPIWGAYDSCALFFPVALQGSLDQMIKSY